MSSRTASLLTLPVTVLGSAVAGRPVMVSRARPRASGAGEPVSDRSARASLSGEEEADRHARTVDQMRDTIAAPGRPGYGELASVGSAQVCEAPTLLTSIC
jgi:hypothetical protein